MIIPEVHHAGPTDVQFWFWTSGSVSVGLGQNFDIWLSDGSPISAMRHKKMSPGTLQCLWA